MLYFKRVGDAVYASYFTSITFFNQSLVDHLNLFQCHVSDVRTWERGIIKSTTNLKNVLFGY